MTIYTKHTPMKEKQKNNPATSFGNYRRTGMPYNPRMTDKERRELAASRR